jgi:peroxiredoxin
MKNFIAGLSFFLSFLSASAQNKLLISGNTNAFEDGDKVAISVKYPFNTFFSYPEIQDSSIIENGKFSLLLPSATAEFYLMSVTKKNGKKVITKRFLEPCQTQIVIHDSALHNLTITSNRSAAQANSLENELLKVKPPKLYSELFKKYDSTTDINPVLASKIFLRIDSILNILNKKNAIISQNWMNAHPLSLLNSYILYNFLKSQLSDDSLKKEFYQLPLETRKNSWGRELNYIFNNTIAGDKAPDFTETDTSGNQLSLSNFLGKGKYILLDFWASWCGPCRKINPALRGVYDDFKNKNFAIIGISLDQSKKKWKEAIKKDSLSWPQVSDLNYWKNKVAQAYYIRSVPSNFLLDPAGKIIARNLTTNELRERLSQLLQ